MSIIWQIMEHTIFCVTIAYFVHLNCKVSILYILAPTCMVCVPHLFDIIHRNIFINKVSCTFAMLMLFNFKNNNLLMEVLK